MRLHGQTNLGFFSSSKLRHGQASDSGRWTIDRGAVRAIQTFRDHRIERRYILPAIPQPTLAAPNRNIQLAIKGR